MQKMNLFKVEEKLTDVGKNIFTLQDVMLLTGASKRATESFLSYNARSGKFLRLKNGLYLLKRGRVNQYEIANRLYQPSYISLETALSHYSIIPEVVYSMTSITTKPTREFITQGASYEYHRIKTVAFTGYAPDSISGVRVFMATPEKAFVDYCYFMYLGDKSWNDRFYLKKLHKALLKEYIDLFENAGFKKMFNGRMKDV